MSSNNFSSTILDDIGDKLSEAVFLSLSNNSLVGVIPKSICNGRALKILDLTDNGLHGRIPECIPEMMCQNLWTLNLRKNNLRSPIPNAFLASYALKKLHLNGNLIQGRVSESLTNCTQLEILDFGNNQMIDEFPSFLMNISTLRVLVLRSNHFHGRLGYLNTNISWAMLQIIDVAHNNFDGELLRQCLSGVKLLMTTAFVAIDLSSNNFSEPIPKEFGQLQSLYTLNLSNNGFTARIPSSLGNLKQLKSVDLSNNRLNGTIPTSLANLKFLSFLNLSYIQLVGKIPLVSLPTGQRIVDCKWIFKAKEGLTHCEPVRFKARAVAKGFTQVEGVDYNEIFSPMVKYTTIIIVLALITHFNWNLEQLDVKKAF